MSPDTALPDRSTLSSDKPITLAILAMGGQGGGVLADWIVALAESCGWVAQSTSVPGVAQRTGATIYYIELLKAPVGSRPVLSLMPTPGDVDIVMAAELMEAGRSVLRGLVTPDRTTLIASTHRSYAVGEKEKPGDGIGDPGVVVEATDFAAKRTIAFDMELLATKQGSVISATMFGALAGSGLLPFSKSDFEATIRAGGKGIDASLRAFNASFERAQAPKRDAISRTPEKRFSPLPGDAGHPKLNALVEHIKSDFPEALHPMLFAGCKKLVDFQDVEYAEEYLARLNDLLQIDRLAGGEPKAFQFTLEAAKYVAVAMAYDDIYRVADLKTREGRHDRIRSEVGALDHQIVYTVDYMHPRMEEVCGSLPRGLGRWIEARPKLFNALDRVVNRGRRVRSGTIAWFLVLYVIAGFKSHRRMTLRHEREVAHRESWLKAATDVLPVNYDLAVQIIRARRLVKGYSDTHRRGTSKFDRVLSAIPALVGRSDGGDWLNRLQRAALLDENGIALDGALKTIATL